MLVTPRLRQLLASEVECSRNCKRGPTANILYSEMFYYVSGVRQLSTFDFRCSGFTPFTRHETRPVVLRL